MRSTSALARTVCTPARSVPAHLSCRGDPPAAARLFGGTVEQALGRCVDQVVDAEFHEFIRHRLGVFGNLHNIIQIIIRECFTERDCLCCDHMLERTTLCSRENT